MENNEMQDIINILDEDGKEHSLEIIDALEYDDRQYLALLPMYDEDEAQEQLEESGELVILRVSNEQDEDGQDYLECIEDDDEYKAVSEIFIKRLETEYDFDDEGTSEE